MNNEDDKLLEQKVRSVRNIKVYGKEKFKDNLVASLKFAAPVVAIPVTLSLLHNVFGVDLQVNNPSFVWNMVNHFSSVLSCWNTSLVDIGAAVSGWVIGSSYETIKDVNEMKKLKYYLRNRAVIKIGSEKDISILDAENLSKDELKDYAEKGRSKVLKY